MLKIRLARVGKRNSPIFRLVVAEKSRAVKRQSIEILGLYNPGTTGNKFQVNKERVLFWIGKGAQPSLTVNNLLCDFGVLAKNQKVKVTFGKAQKKKDIKTAKEKKPAAPVVITEGTGMEAEEDKPQDMQENTTEDQPADNQPETKEKSITDGKSVQEKPSKDK